MAFNKDKSEAAKSIFTSSVTGLANVAAFAAAFLATPAIYGLSSEWMNDFTAKNYGPEWSDITDPIWFVVIALTTFFVARASISTVLVMGGLAIAARFF
tara:strand:+ start:13736 stop:14032 length:297 start_codon:yes stop_codon:yes gene_type:complete